MPSLTKSEFRHLQRTDGGPFLIIERVEYEGEIEDPEDDSNANVTVYVRFTDVHPDTAREEETQLLLVIRPEYLEIYPINVRPDKPDFLQPKYKNLTTIAVSRQVSYPYDFPASVEEVEELLSDLPSGFDKNFRFGLGLDYKYRHIATSVARLEGINTLWIHGGAERGMYDPPIYWLTEGQFHVLRKEMNAIAAKAQRKALREKVLLAHNSLLTPISSVDFPPQGRVLETGEIAALRGNRRTPVSLSKVDQRAVLDLISDNVEKMVASEPQSLMQLKGDIEVVTLKELIGRFEAMLGKALSEARWQTFFEQNPFVLSLALSVPFILVQSRAYAGGKRWDGSGGKHPDFFYAAASTGNVAIVEIKRPGTPLLQGTSYRPDVFGLSGDVTGAVSQVLSQRHALHRNIANFKEDEPELVGVHAFSTKCVVVAGRNPESHMQKKNFELARNAIVDVTIITFDELLARLQALHEAMSKPLQPAPLDDDLPF